MHNNIQNDSGFLYLLSFLTGFLILLWIFGSYFTLIATENFNLCFPPLDGCTYISKAGNYKYSSIVYRATVLPTTSLLAIVNYLLIVKIKNSYSIGKKIFYLLIFLGLILAPLSLNITESILNGTQYKVLIKIHKLFALLAFVGEILFQIIISIQFYKAKKNFLTLFMLIISIFELLIPLILLIDNSHKNKVMVEWNLTIILAFWYIIFSSKSLFQRR